MPTRALHAAMRPPSSIRHCVILPRRLMPCRRISSTWRGPRASQRGRTQRSRETVVAADSSTQVECNTVEDRGHGLDGISSGKVVGFLGGGQLGRMAALAAANMGVKVKCLDPTPFAPASVAAEQVVGDFRDPQAILQFAKQCDILTVEIEHVDVNALREVTMQIGTPVQPSPDTIDIIQDKYRQKLHFQAHGIPIASSVDVDDLTALSGLCKQGLPLMLKARRLAYDGRGNYVVQNEDDIESAVQALGGFEAGLYVEKWVNFAKELAVIVAKSATGEILSYPVVETIHKNSICFVTEAPANIDHQVSIEATQLAEKAVSSLDGSGVYGVEMFLLPGGEVILNEVAPRPHNSGHYTIDACYTSQFEQHIRAILGWPLGNACLTVSQSRPVHHVAEYSVQAGSAIMLNVLGEAEGIVGLQKAQSLLQHALKVPGAKVHWYDKSEVQKDRKIGHINIIGPTRGEVRGYLRQLNQEAFSALTSTQTEGRATHDTVPQVGIIMGSDSDLPTMKAAADVLDSFGAPVQVTVVSAHRTPERMLEYAKSAHKRGLKVIIAGAGGAAHLPGMVASLTPLPVIGVPCVPSGSHLDGLDALMSIVQMPRGVPVATVGIGNAANAGLLAVRILGVADATIVDGMIEYQSEMKHSVMEKVDRLESHGWKHYS